EGSEAGHRVCRRAARTFRARPHCRVQRVGLRLVDERHGALRELLLFQESVVGAGNDVDNGVADADNVVLDGSHYLVLVLRSEAGATLAALPSTCQRNSCRTTPVRVVAKAIPAKITSIAAIRSHVISSPNNSTPHRMPTGGPM